MDIMLNVVILNIKAQWRIKVFVMGGGGYDFIQ